jgi:hypothetical protein
METDLYFQIQNHLVNGYNIQTLEHRTWVNKEGVEVGDIVITYLYGERLILPVNPALSQEDLQTILEKINTIQEAGCYPQAESNCELGIKSLN